MALMSFCVVSCFGMQSKMNQQLMQRKLSHQEHKTQKEQRMLEELAKGNFTICSLDHGKYGVNILYRYENYSFLKSIIKHMSSKDRGILLTQYVDQLRAYGKQKDPRSAVVIDILTSQPVDDICLQEAWDAAAKEQRESLTDATISQAMIKNKTVLLVNQEDVQKRAKARIQLYASALLTEPYPTEYQYNEFIAQKQKQCSYVVVNRARIAKNDRRRILQQCSPSTRDAIYNKQAYELQLRSAHKSLE